MKKLNEMTALEFLDNLSKNYSQMGLKQFHAAIKAGEDLTKLPPPDKDVWVIDKWKAWQKLAQVRCQLNKELLEKLAQP